MKRAKIKKGRAFNYNAAIRDLVMIIILMILTFIVASRFDLHERYERWVAKINGGSFSEASELIIVLAVSAFLFLIFAVRRLKEAWKVNKELKRHREHLEELVLERSNSLHDSQEKARAILDHAIQFIGLLTPDGILVEANRAAIEFAGVDSSDVIDKPFWEGPWWSHSPALREKLRQGIKSASRGEFVRFEATHPDKHGALHYVDFSLKPVKNESGMVAYIVPEGRDITENKNAEIQLAAYRNHLEELVKEKTEALKKSEYKFETIFNESMDGMLLAEIDTKRFVMCNKAICDMLGYSEEEILNLGVGNIHPEAHRLRVIKIFESQTRGELKLAENLPMMRKDGSIFYADANVSKIESGGKGYLMGSFRDVTERKRLSEQIIKLSDLKKELLITGNIDKKLKIVTDRIVEIFDADFARIWMVGQGDLCQRGCIHAVVTEGPHICHNRDKCLHLMASSGRYIHTDGGHRRVPIGCYKIGRIASGEWDNFITNNVTHDSLVHDQKWAESLGLVSFAGYRFTSTEGASIGVMALFAKHAIMPSDENLLKDLASSVSHAILTETSIKALAESEESYRSIFELANDAIIVRDIDTYEIVDVNRKACEIFCYPKEELLGLPFGSLSVFSDTFTREKLKGYYDKASRGEPQLFERISRDKFGREFWIDMNVKRTIVAGKARLLCVARDITDRKRASDMKDNFTNMVSHELRTPLATIKESISLVSEGDMGPVTKEQNDMFSIIKRNTDRLARLINQVLDLQKFEAGAMKFDYKVHDINRIADEAYRTMLSLASKKKLRLVFKSEAGLPVAKFDRDKISEVIINLIDNAIRHTEKGTVTIATALSDNYIKVSVADTGHGISQEDMPKLFQRFSQLERKAGGTGLGLAICKEIVETHSGTIWAESEPGKGTVFHFTLPLER